MRTRPGCSAAWLCPHLLPTPVPPHPPWTQQDSRLHTRLSSWPRVSFLRILAPFFCSEFSVKVSFLCSFLSFPFFFSSFFYKLICFQFHLVDVSVFSYLWLLGRGQPSWINVDIYHRPTVSVSCHKSPKATQQLGLTAAANSKSPLL